MNTKPDDELLARWLEDELQDTDRGRVESWAAGQPGWIEWRAEIRSWKATIRRALPGELEPPAAEFFAARIGRSVREDLAASGPRAVESPRASGPRRWWMPVAAAAGMALCFWAGMQAAATRAAGPGRQAQRLAASAVAPSVYTPEQGVEARVFESDAAEAMVIVLEGVAAIPDSFEIPDRAAADPPATAPGVARAAEPRSQQVQ